VVTGVFGLLGLVGAAWVQEISYDFVTRTWKDRRGFLHWADVRERGSFDDFEALVLERRFVRTSPKQRPSAGFLISLQAAGSPELRDLWLGADEREARRRLAEWAGRFGLPARELDAVGERA
jgi:hypothetical protein